MRAHRDEPPQVGALVAGTSDLTKDLHAIHTPDRVPLLTSCVFVPHPTGALCGLPCSAVCCHRRRLSTIVLAARAAGVTPLDGVHLDIKDGDGFHAACVQVCRRVRCMHYSSGCCAMGKGFYRVAACWLPCQGRELGFDGKVRVGHDSVDL